MIVLHGIWNSDRGASTPDFFLWGEASKTATTRRRPAKRPDANPRPHPFLAKKEEICAAFHALPIGGSPLQALASAKPDSISLLLPSQGDERPYASPDLALEEDEGRVEQTPLLQPWLIRGLRLSSGQVLEVLPFLPPSPDLDVPGVVLGGDLKFWATAARYALDLLARQRFLPTLQESDDGQVLSRWEPVLADAEDRRQLDILSDSMPHACRSASALKPASTTTTSPRDLLSGFLATVVDSQIRVWLGKAADNRITNLHLYRSDPMVERWIRSLRSQNAAISASAFQLASFKSPLETWLAPLTQLRQEGGFRSCFRLEAPQAGNDDTVVQCAAADRDWTLRFFLQADDDLSLLVPASSIWKERGRVLNYLNRRFENPQERLLADLGRAALIFPPIEASLRSACPELCNLTLDEAYQFLREAAPLFEESGFGVLVPPWWEKRKKQVGLKLRLKSPPNAGKGLIGRDAIVGYDWQLALGGDEISPQEFARLAALKLPLVRIRGEWVELDSDQIERAIRYWESRLGKGELSVAEALRLLMAQDGGQDGTTLVEVEASGWLSSLVSQLRQGERLAELPVPEGFSGKLRPYQVRGYSWLAFMRQWGLGACLADDMGLGKTIQFIALLLRDIAENGSQPTLLICPTSVVGNWRREVARFAPSARVWVHHGIDRLAGEAFVEKAREHELVITTYPLVHRDEGSLEQVDWRGIVLDEAQNIKNSATKQAQSVRKLQAGYRIALTGTPVENRLTELWSIMQFLNAGYLGSAESFRRTFAVPIERWQNAERAAELRELVQPFILRRLKSDPKIIEDLPDKMEMKVYCTLTREQATLYEAIVKDMMEQIEEAENIQRKGLVLAALTKLKQVCNHPAHFLGDRSALAGRSGKLARLEEMLEELLSEGDRALVFTQFAAFGAMLQQYLQSTFGREVLFLHGGVAQKARDHMVNRFQEDPHGPALFILSIKAGGLGLNLTRANHVFHFDRWWNPAVENQATDRAFRIGQKRNVQVHKFLCAGTMEERIDELIESKKALADNVIGAGESWLTELSTDQLRDVFTLRRETVADD